MTKNISITKPQKNQIQIFTTISISDDEFNKLNEIKTSEGLNAKKVSLLEEEIIHNLHRSGLIEANPMKWDLVYDVSSLGEKMLENT